MAVPDAPTALVATPAITTVSIAFTQAAATPEVTNYQVSIDGGAYAALDPVDAATPIVLSGLDQGTEYTVLLKAVNTDGLSAASDALVFTTDDVPAAPTSLVSTVGDNQVSIAFTAGADNGAAITDYEYNLNGDGWVSAGVTATPVVVTGLPNDLPASITLRAVNAAGNGTASAASVSTPTDADLTDNDGFTDATVFANPGLPVPHLDYNDPDD